MAIYHLHVDNISRGDGRSAVAAAAYRAGETLPNDAEEKLSKFGGRRDVRFTEIRLPDGAPEWAGDRAILWNAVERAEKRIDARLAKEIELALPREMALVDWLAPLRAFADVYTARGHCVDLAIHDDGEWLNPHVHMMLTLRPFAGEAFAPKKLREADNLAFVTEARAMWWKIANEALGKAGAGVEIDARSYAARGVDKEPGQHKGPDRAQRRARRDKREKPRAMMHDTLEARRELLADAKALERYPLLRARPDWPPEEQAAMGLTPEERAEFRAFWQEVYRRQLDPDRAPDAPTVSAPDPVAAAPETRQAPQPAAKVVEPPRVREPGLRFDGALTLWETTDKAAREWAALELALARAQEAEGREPITPRSREEWHALTRAANDFKATIAELRAQAEQNRAYSQAMQERYFSDAPDDADIFPEAGPDSRPLAPSERTRAQDAMLNDVRADVVPETPRPGEPPAAERRAAERTVLKEAHRDDDKVRRRDPELTWLDDPSPHEASGAREPTRDPDLAWLHDDDEPDRADGPDRDRDR